MLVALVTRPLEVPRQQVTAQYDQGNREETRDRNEREGPKDLNNQKEASRDQHYSNQRCAFDERALESLFIDCGVLPASDQYCGAVGINY